MTCDMGSPFHEFLATSLALLVCLLNLLPIFTNWVVCLYIVGFQVFKKCILAMSLLLEIYIAYTFQSVI